MGSRSDPSAAEGTFFAGAIDEPAIFTNALSAADIFSVYNAAQVPPGITRAPHLPPGTIYEGAALTLSVWAEGSPTLGYQWTWNGVPVPGQTATNFTRGNLLTASNGTYAVIVTNTYGSATSAVSLVVVSSPPLITRQPQTVTKYEGESVVISVAAEGSLPLSYQWKYYGGDITDATNSSYTIAALTLGDAGEYSVAISNARGDTNSAVATLTVQPAPVVPDGDVLLTGVPDYNWYAGCFGTATGNLMGYWDRHGLPDFYSGPTAGGVAPMDDCGGNTGIRSMWATKAGLDGRPANLPGHVDDYWADYTFSLANCGNVVSFSYESTAEDPYKLASRAEHTPDCVGDFIGLSQKKWTDMNNECDGNIDAFSFVYWDTNGNKRVNFIPPPQGNNILPDIPSGLREWTRYRGYDAEVFSQLVDFNPNSPLGQGLRFAELRAEIDAGYPALVFLQSYTNFSRSLPGMPKANPEIHGMLIYGYQAYAGYGTNVYCRTSWGPGHRESYNWSTIPWTGNLSVRGVIGFHPKPRIRSIARNVTDVTIAWDGPASQLLDVVMGTTTALHHYQLERSLTLNPADFQPIGSPTTDLTITLPECCLDAAYFRVQLLPP